MMKLLKLSCVLLGLASVVLFSGCSDDDEKSESIIVDDKSSLSQDVFADNTAGSGLNFTTSGPWTSSVKAVSGTRAGETRAESVNWVSLNPSSGSKAGSYTVELELEANKTGEDRSATISILCGDSEISINVKQKGVKEDGSSGLVRTIAFRVQSCNDQWTPKNGTPYLPAENAEVKVYSGSASTLKLVGTYTANANGIALAELEDGLYTYTAAKGEETNITEAGYLVSGLFTDYIELERAQYGALGWPRYYDANGDQQINAEDKVENVSLTVAKNDTTHVYLAAPRFTPSYIDPVLSMYNAETAYGRVVRNAYLIDASLMREITGGGFGDFSFDSNNSTIDKLWEEAYTMIEKANLMLEMLDESGFDDTEKNSYIADACYYRMYAYSTLLNYFGAVPIYTTSSFDEQPRDSTKNVVDFIFDNGDKVVDFSANRRMAASQIMARVALNKGDLMDAYPLLQRIVNSGYSTGFRYLTPDEWGLDAIDGGVVKFVSLPSSLTNGKGMEVIPIRYTETVLMYAEAAVGVGNMMEAITILNNAFNTIEADDVRALLPLGNATQQEVRNSIMSLWKRLLDREGHTFAMMKRTNTFLSTFGTYGAKTKHLLLPIPRQALEANKKLTQNFGW